MDEVKSPWSRLNFKTHFLVVLVAFFGSGLYFKFVQQPKRAALVQALQQAPASEVVKRLGKPDKELDAATFNAKEEALADKGTPLCNNEVEAQGSVWLYKDTTYGYLTVFFDTNNYVAKVQNTYWMEGP
jgi:hypothetical protein